MKKYVFWGLSCLFFLLIIWHVVSEGGNKTFHLIHIKTKERQISYHVEIADTPEKAQTGLMWRKFMAQNEGMLFVFPQSSMIKMWMKNTLIPLDMIFFNAQNQIICLHSNARPLDESVISCPYPAQKVLELNAGQINEKKLQLGDTLFFND